MFDGKRVLIFGGTGSLATVLSKRLIEKNAIVYAFSRNEEKHFAIKQKIPSIRSVVGDIRDYDVVFKALFDVRPEYVINTAALKQVPLCEEFPYETVMTNVVGTQNLVRAIENYLFMRKSVVSLKVLSVSTDKAISPINLYGFSKALQERIHLRGKFATFNSVRYGNVLQSSGSVIPFFKQRIENKLNLPITDSRMTRFFLSLDQAVDLIFKALEDTEGRKVFIPKCKSGYVTDLAEILLEENKKDYKDKKIEYVGIRPGEKINEILFSEEETYRTEDLGDIFVVHDILETKKFDDVKGEYSSGLKDNLMNKDELREFLKEHGVI